MPAADRCHLRRPFSGLLCHAILAFILTTPLCATPDSPFRPITPVRPLDPEGAPPPSARVPEGVPAAVIQRLNSFFAALKSQTPREAFFALFSGTKFADSREITDKFVTLTENSFRSYGPLQSHHYWEVQNTGERILTVTHLSQHEFKLLRWRFIFFAPVGNKWTLLNLKVDDLRGFLPHNPNKEQPPQEIRIALERFFVQFQADQVDRAFDEFIRGSDLESLTEGVDAFKNQARTAVEAFGKMQSYELYDHRVLPNQLRLLTYIVSLENEPLRWQFFYRINPQTSQWILFNLRVDDLLDESVLAAD